MHFNFKKGIFFLPAFLFSYNLNINKIDELSKTKYWHILGHYKNNVSEIDSPNFFLSKNGKYSPFEELNATIYYLINPKFKDDNSIYCRFPARREWIKTNFPNLPIKKQNCKELKKELNAIKNISSVTLVFPTILMNSPASMFGHTLLRLDDKSGDLLNSFAVNFAAYTNETNGLIYAYKGLTGGYIGKYAIVPYYKKIQEYNDIKNRDIWEYKLNLTKKEIEKLKLHLYEVKSTYSYYYYFNKNCSYQILWLLEAARPSLTLVEKFNYKVLPVDTIKECNNEHLIKTYTYRPSKQKIILNYFKNIKNKSIALKFIKTYNFNLLKKLSLNDKKYILDLGAEYIRYKYLKDKLNKQKYIKTYLKLLKKRSKLGEEKKLTIKPPTKNPIFSHDSNKIWIYAKHNNLLIGIKPAFHNIDDINTGFENGAYIDFFPIEFEIGKISKLNYFYFFDIKSYSKINPIFKPISWKVSLGFERFKNKKLYSTLKTGAGYTIGNKNILASLFLDLKDYYKTKNYFVKGFSFYNEYNFKRQKFIISLSRNFTTFKNYNTYNFKLINRIKRNFNISIGYKKDLNENYFFGGFDIYFL